MSDVEFKIQSALPLVSNILNSISATSSLIVIVIFSTLGFYRPKLIDRVSLKLQFGISVIDLLNSFFALFHHSVKSGPFCVFIGFWRAFGEEMYCLLNIAIAVNLQLVFIHSFPPKKKWELFYWFGPILTASVLSFIPLGMNLYGLNKGKVCFIKEDLPNSYPIILLNTSIIYSITFIYLFIVSFIIIMKLRDDRNTVISMSHLANTAKLGDRVKLIKRLKKLIIRVSLYPIAALFGLSGFVVAYINNAITGGKRNIGISLWGMIGITTKGTVNLITFLLDPSVQHALKKVWQDVSRGIRSRFGGNARQDVVPEGGLAYTDSTEIDSSERLVVELDAETLERYL
ncbi:hypothetical protein K502DRAFT_326261 [Neoconidiobolus thromboides FSU 785]|nr:hypothetical protein K502DRAFT_326261 [Neoconidiobolus thromboides FSU 785]